MNPQDPAIVIREHLLELCLGSIFTFVAVCALSVVAIRRRRELLVLLWSGSFMGIYGVRLLAQAARSLSLLPHSAWPERIDVLASYSMLIPGLLFWVELSIGNLRRFLSLVTILASAVAAIGIGYFATTGSPDKVLPLNNLLAIVMLVVLGVIVAIPKLSKRLLVIQSRVITLYLPSVAVVSLYYNASGIFNYEASRSVEPVAFVVWMLALGYIAVQRVFANERRLLAIDNELQTARQIQFSILPERIPKCANLRIAAAYHPMSAVAGDFYQFIQPDERHLGVLIADVSGHGVPAALFSSMIKVAMQSVVDSAVDPGQLLCRLNRILSPELRGQLISAAYLWIDGDENRVRYSAAGHPPLLCWRGADGELRKIESNGLLFGVADDSQYPVRTLPLNAGDRFLLYTDGVSEPENAGGEAFGDRQLEHVLRSDCSESASTLLRQLLAALRGWQSASLPQQDDITLIVIDAV